MKIKLSKDGVFLSLSGEHGLFMQGEPCIFVRLAGCNLKCSYCDADFSLAEEVEIEEVVNRIIGYKNYNVLITGGEPLLQQDAVLRLIKALEKKNGNYRFQIETNGTIKPEAKLFHMVDCWVVDFKDPSHTKETADIFLKTYYPPGSNRIVFKAILKPEQIDSFIFGIEDYFRDIYQTYPGLVHKVKVSLSPLMPQKNKVSQAEVEEYLNDFTNKFLSALKLQKISCTVAPNLALNFQLHKLIGCP